MPRKNITTSSKQQASKDDKMLAATEGLRLLMRGLEIMKRDRLTLFPSDNNTWSLWSDSDEQHKVSRVASPEVALVTLAIVEESL